MPIKNPIGLGPGIPPSAGLRVERYYIDATDGNDANSGRGPDTPWQTIGQINGFTFQLGDNILFKAGETWTGTALVVPQSNLVFGSYGTGANPIIDGDDTANCVVATAKNNLTFRDLEATQGVDFGFVFTTCINVSIINCDAHDCGNDNLIFITDCHDCTVTGGEFYAGYQRVPTTIVSGIEIADGCHNIVVDGVTAKDQIDDGVGVTIHSHDGTILPYDITVKNCTFSGNAGNGIQVVKQDDTADSDRNINIFDNVMTANTLDGVRTYKTAGADNVVSGVNIYDNYSHGNTRYAYFFEGDNLLVRNNRFRGRGFISSCDGMDFWNNTMYFETGGGLYPIYITGSRTDGVSIKNNILFLTTAGGMGMGVDTTVTGANVDIDYNLYYLAQETVENTRWHWLGVAKNWADWLNDSGQSANSPAIDQDPKLVNAPTDMTLDTGSPAIDAGVDVGLPFLGTAPDCGYAERE